MGEWPAPAAIRRDSYGSLLRRRATRRLDARGQRPRRVRGKERAPLAPRVGHPPGAAERQHALGGALGLESAVRVLPGVLVEQPQRRHRVAELQRVVGVAQQPSLGLEGRGRG